MIDRRTFVFETAAGLFVTTHAALAQSIGRIVKIGILNFLPREAPLPQKVIQGLRDLGYVDGRNLVIEYRSGPQENFPALAADLVKARVDLIYAVLDQAALAASKATTTIPVVFAVLGDPVRSGLVASLSHPGRNLTGLTAFSSELNGKRFQILKELLPRLTRVGFLWNPATAKTPEIGLEKPTEAARSLSVELRPLPVRDIGDLGDVLDRVEMERIDALVVEEDSLTYWQRDRIVAYAAAHRLPAIYGYRDYVLSGGLVSYGARLPELMQLALEYIDKILKGTKPGDLPVQQPSKFELVINQNAAKSIGLTIPQSLLLRADEVIQ